MQYGKLNTVPTTYSFDFIVDMILGDQIDKLWDLELDLKVRFRSIERFQRFDYFAHLSESEMRYLYSSGLNVVRVVSSDGYSVRATRS